MFSNGMGDVDMILGNAQKKSREVSHIKVRVPHWLNLEFN